MVGHSCIACGEVKSGNTEEGMICAMCHLIRGISTVKEAEEYRQKQSTGSQAPAPRPEGEGAKVEELFPCLNCGSEIRKEDRRLSNQYPLIYDRCAFCSETEPSGRGVSDGPKDKLPQVTDDLGAAEQHRKS
jgi:hypothetical protein